MTKFFILNVSFFRGRLEWPDGTVYEGEFEDGNFQGYVSHDNTLVSFAKFHFCTIHRAL